MPKAFDRVVYNGKLMDEKTKAFIQAMEARLGYSLTITQGCYNPGGVAASGGTHDGGGVVDLAPFDADRKVHVARALGAFAWHRQPIPGLWPEHVHLGIRNHGRLSPAAAAQQIQYDGHPPRNGLADKALDPTFHPSPSVTFQYPPPPPVPRVPRRHVFHVHHGRFYYVEDSLRGVRLALTRLFGWIDLDIQKTRDGVLVVAHGPRPLANKFTGGFEDPLGLIDKSATFADLTWLEVQRLRSGDRRGYRVWRADELIPLAVKKGLRVEAEAKTSAITEADWEALRAVLPNPSKVQVKAFPKFARSLKAAHNAGFKTIVLLHTAEEASVPTAAQKFIDYFRGRTPIWIPTKETP